MPLVGGFRDKMHTYVMLVDEPNGVWVLKLYGEVQGIPAYESYRMMRTEEAATDLIRKLTEIKND